MTYPDNCPNCGASFKGEPIPEKDREWFGEKNTHFSRVIGISNGSSVVEWMCPDCNYRFPRHSRIRYSARAAMGDSNDG